MYKLIISEVAQPLFRRAGTFVGSAALAAGLVSDVSQLEAAVTLVLGIAFDLVMSHLDRKVRK